MNGNFKEWVGWLKGLLNAVQSVFFVYSVLFLKCGADSPVFTNLLEFMEPLIINKNKNSRLHWLFSLSFCLFLYNGLCYYRLKLSVISILVIVLLLSQGHPAVLLAPGKDLNDFYQWNDFHSIARKGHKTKPE